MLKVLISLSLIATSFTLFASNDTEKWTVHMNIPSFKLKAEEFPTFDDDLNLAGMEIAIKRQMAAFKRAKLRGSITLGNIKRPISVLKTSLKAFEKEVDRVRDCLESSRRESCFVEFNRRVKAKFDLYQPLKKREGVGREPAIVYERDFAKFTGYYSPTLKASKTRTAQFPYAIYKKPSTDTRRRTTRNEIIWGNKLRNKNLELFYVSDLFELYLLHVEGGGRVEIDTPSGKQMHYLSYSAHNSNKFRFISKYMRAQGYIQDGKIDTQRAFLKAHPEKEREIYNYCPGYIYFNVSKTEPLGLEDIPLTMNHSLAQDRKIYKRKGLIAFVRTTRPVRGDDGEPKEISYSRFYLDQDTGSAIVGEARADLYFGYGDEAELAANSMNETGEIFFLVSK